MAGSHKLHPLTVALAGVPLVPFSAFAQDEDNGNATVLPSINISTRANPLKPESESIKFTAPLLDTPRSVTIIPQATIEERGARSLMDVLRTTPGITFGSGEGGTPVGDRPFIRGYEASTDIFIDGMRNLGRISNEAFNLEQVEIIKGPGSAYTGRGSTGGSINMVSKAPKGNNFINANASAGTENDWRLAVDSNWRIADIAAIRVNAMKYKGDVAGRDEVDFNRWGIAPSLILGLNGPTRAIFSYYGIRGKDLPDLGIPFDTINNTGRPIKVDRDNYYGSSTRDWRKNNVDMGTITLEHDINEDFIVRNRTRYSNSLNVYIMTRPTINTATGLVNRDLRSRNSVNTALINQTDLRGKFNLFGIENTFVTGLEFSWEDIKTGTISADVIPQTNLFNPTPNDPYTGNTTYGPRNNLVNRTKTQAFYIFDTAKLHKQIELNLGLRYDDFKISNSTLKNHDTFLNYQVGVVYKPLPYGSIYVSHGTSSNPSGETQGQAGGADGSGAGTLTPTNAELKPEKNRTYEIGTKWDLLNNDLLLTAALFRTEKVNGRSQDPLTGAVVLEGDTRTDGIELGVVGNITNTWQVTAGYTWLNPKVINYWSGNNSFKGNRMKYIGKHSLSLWSTYKITPSINIGGGAYYMSNRFANDANTLTLPSYWRLDAVAGYTINRNWDIRVNLNNLTDENIFEASHVGLFANVAPGRSAFVTVNYTY